MSFSCSVHNAVPGAAAIRFGMKVPVFSLAGFDRLPARVLQLADAVLTAGDAERVLAILAEERSPFADRAWSLSGLDPMEFAAVFLLERADGEAEKFADPDGLDSFSWIRSILP